MNNELWMDDNRWEVYLPGGEYRLNLATRGIEGGGLVPPLKSVAIPAGRRQLQLEQKQESETYRVAVNIDGKKAMEAGEEPKEADLEGVVGRRAILNQHAARWGQAPRPIPPPLHPTGWQGSVQHARRPVRWYPHVDREVGDNQPFREARHSSTSLRARWTSSSRPG